MANQRVVDSDVKQILRTTIDTQPYIVCATLVVTERLVPVGYSADRLRQIELYLSAHLASLQDPGLIELTADGATARYDRGKLGTGLNGTQYGQQIQWLDYLGILAHDNATMRPATLRVD